MTRRDLFKRLLGALASVPVLGKVLASEPMTRTLQLISVLTVPLATSAGEDGRIRGKWRVRCEFQHPVGGRLAMHRILEFQDDGQTEWHEVRREG